MEFQFSPKRAKLYLDLAKRFAEESKDPKTKVGCVIVTPSGVLYPGYNGDHVGGSNQRDSLETGCFVSHARVETKEGRKPISSIQEGDQVLTHVGRYKSVLKKFHRNFEGDLITLHFESTTENCARRTSATSEHPFLVKTDDGISWKEIKNIEVGEKVAIRTKVCEDCPVKIPFYRRLCNDCFKFRSKSKKIRKMYSKRLSENNPSLDEYISTKKDQCYSEKGKDARKKKYPEIKNQYDEIKWVKYDKDHLRYNDAWEYYNDNFIWVKVTLKKKKKIKQKVFNLEVEDDSSYVCSNCVVHNCSGFIHAEENAIIKFDPSYNKGSRMYLTHSPCLMCSKRIINTCAITEVYYNKEYKADTSGIDLLRSAGIFCKELK